MQKDISLSRRSLLAAGATGAAVAAASAAEAASFGNPDEPAEGAVNVVNPKALSDPGPQDPQPAGIPQSAANRRQRHAAVLGVVQSCPQANPERRLGAAGDPG
jgi:hypothetical protein